MTVFVDASALVAIVMKEADALHLIDRLGEHDVRLTSGIALWEAARAVAKGSRISTEAAWQICERLRTDFGIDVVSFGTADAVEAIDAHQRYGKGTGHPARLNMGDCFAYACAKTNEARLLYKGDDFIHTDLA